MPLLLCNKRPVGIFKPFHDFLPFLKWFLICLCCWMITSFMTDGWLEKEKAKQKRLPFWASRSRKCQWNGYFAGILKEQCVSRNLQLWTSGYINCVVWHTFTVCYLTPTLLSRINLRIIYSFVRLSGPSLSSIFHNNNITSLLGTACLKGCIIAYSYQFTTACFHVDVLYHPK